MGGASASSKKKGVAGPVRGHALVLGVAAAQPARAQGVGAVPGPAARSSAGLEPDLGPGVQPVVAAVDRGPGVQSVEAIPDHPSSAARDHQLTRVPARAVQPQSGAPLLDLPADHAPGPAQSQNPSQRASPGAAASRPRPTTATTRHLAPGLGRVRGPSLPSRTTMTTPMIAVEVM